MSEKTCTDTLTHTSLGMTCRERPIQLSLGPFQGITDAPFRNVFKRHFGGIDKYYTPFFTGIHK